MYIILYFDVWSSLSSDLDCWKECFWKLDVGNRMRGSNIQAELSTRHERTISFAKEQCTHQLRFENTLNEADSVGSYNIIDIKFQGNAYNNTNY